MSPLLLQFVMTPAWMAVVRVKTTHARTTELALKTAPGATTASVIPTMRDRTVSRVGLPVVALY